MALFFCLKDCLEETDFDYFWFLISTNQQHCLPSCSISSTITKPLLTLNTLNNRCRVMDSTVPENSLNTCLLYNMRTSTYVHTWNSRELSESFSHNTTCTDLTWPRELFPLPQNSVFEDGKITAHFIPLKSNLKEIQIPNGVRTLQKTVLLELLRKVLEF